MVGYRWMPEMRNGIERSCWTDVATDEVQRELEWLRDTVNGGAWGSLPSGESPWLRVSAVEVVEEVREAGLRARPDLGVFVDGPPRTRRAEGAWQW